jgi:predicted enzyme related to lactoylglutathione lyase
MLSKASMTTMLPVTDVERASRFYAETLGLNLRTTAADGSPIFDAGSGDAIGLLRAAPGAQSAHTVLTFEVADITAEIRDLEGRGWSSRTTTYRISRLSTTSRRSATSAPPGSRTPRGTSSAFTKCSRVRTTDRVNCSTRWELA